MPFSKYKDHADCVAKNRDKDNPHAYCADIENTIKKRRKAKGEDATAKCEGCKAEFEALSTEDLNTDNVWKTHDLSEEQMNQYVDLFKKEKAEHPDFTDDQIWQIVQDHVKSKVQAEKKLNNRITFGIDSIPFFNRFQAGAPNELGDIPIVGTYLDFETTTNGWRIDPAEEENLVSDQGKVTFRVAHSKEPERVIGEYKRFHAEEDDGCVDAYGKPLGRHIDFEAVTNPQDPQLRTNILKGWVNDISPGLDAEVFCSECGVPWGLDDENKLVKSCEHQGAEGILRNITKKEGSMVTEPAFEGRTQFRPAFTFAMAMNKLFSCSPSKSEAGGSRVSPDKEGSTQPVTADNQKEKGESQMVSDKEPDEGHRANADANTKANPKTEKVEVKAEGKQTKAEGEGEGEGDSADARIRAALKDLGTLRKAEGELAKLGYVRKAEGEGEGAKPPVVAKAEGDGAETPPPDKQTGPAQPTQPAMATAAKATVTGAQIPSAEPTLSNKPPTIIAPSEKFKSAFEAEMLPHLKQRFGVS